MTGPELLINMNGLLCGKIKTYKKKANIFQKVQLLRLQHEISNSVAPQQDRVVVCEWNLIHS